MNKAPLLTTKAEAAAQLSISVRYLEHLIKQARLPVVRFGTGVRIPVRAVAALAAKGAPGRDLALVPRKEGIAMIGKDYDVGTPGG